MKILSAMTIMLLPIISGCNEYTYAKEQEFKTLCESKGMAMKKNVYGNYLWCLDKEGYKYSPEQMEFK